MLRLAFRDLQVRARRFTISVVSAALVFGVVLAMTAFAASLRRETVRTVDHFGADGWVVKDGKDGPFTTALVLDSLVADDLLTRGATEADPIVIHPLSVAIHGKDLFVRVLGHRRDGLGAPNVLAGRAAGAAGELVASRESKLELGETVRISGRTFKVTGVTEGITITGGIPFLFMDIEDAQDLLYNGEWLASAILVRGDLTSLPEGTRMFSAAGTISDVMRVVQITLSALTLTSLLLWVAATALMAGVVYLSALERLRDFAVFKALGSSTSSILGSVILESMMLALAATAVGAVLAWLLRPLFPVHIDLTAAALVQLVVLSVVAALVASAGGVRRAVRVDPALAFAAAGG